VHAFARAGLVILPLDLTGRFQSTVSKPTYEMSPVVSCLVFTDVPGGAFVDLDAFRRKQLINRKSNQSKLPLGNDVNNSDCIPSQDMLLQYFVIFVHTFFLFPPPSNFADISVCG